MPTMLPDIKQVCIKDLLDQLDVIYAMTFYVSAMTLYVSAMTLQLRK